MVVAVFFDTVCMCFNAYFLIADFVFFVHGRILIITAAGKCG